MTAPATAVLTYKCDVDPLSQREAAVVSALVGVSLVVAVVAVSAIRMVRRGRAATAGRALRVAAFILTVVPATYLAIGHEAKRVADWNWRYLIGAVGVPVLLTGVAVALPRSGSAVVPLTWGTAIVLLWWVGIFSIVGIGVLYWPAALVLIAAAMVETTRGPPRNGRES